MNVLLPTALSVWILAMGTTPLEAKAPAAPHAAKAHDRDCVILLHGLARTRRAMQPLADLLAAKGYAVVNLDYPSTRHPVETLVRSHLAPAVDACRKEGFRRIHFVGHSLGGILVRHYFQDRPAPPGSRMVMLGPPNKGSEVAGRLRNCFLYRKIMGPAGQQLDATPQSLPNRLQPIPLEIGIIAGTFSINPLFSHLLPGPDDGKVTVERAKLAEMKDFITLSCSHGFLVTDREAMHQTAHFLDHGAFDR
ncbi:MAG: alpha/beta fold hydrolase [Desulfobacterales bacterium]|nr:alpha/beta fold hydrolase [Desulfobacterales bacterium]